MIKVSPSKPYLLYTWERQGTSPPSTLELAQENTEGRKSKTQGGPEVSREPVVQLQSPAVGTAPLLLSNCRGSSLPSAPPPSHAQPPGPFLDSPL